jgi:putative AbiEii toxin of type IV toxin-antitoxin system/AAA domain-containing protein
MERTTDWFEITRLRLQRIRGFEDLKLDFLDADSQPRKRILIIGKNGTCKSSLLRAIAIGLAEHTDASRLISEPIGGLVTGGAAEGSIEIFGREAGKGSLEIVFHKKPQQKGDKESFSLSLEKRKVSPFVCGYGAGRFGIGSEASREYRIADSVYTLFNYQQPLTGTELTLRRLSDFLSTRVYERTLAGIKRALGLTDADEIRLGRGGGIEIVGPSIGKAIRIEGWADGYRMTFMWILDLYAWAMKAGSIDEDGHIEGILLIDEIEQHLHPSMQAEILPRLSELLPKMQIFATTHSPLVALDAKPEELVVLKRKGDRVVVQESIPDFSGYSAEDMLADPHLFDSEVYGQETREKLDEYRQLVSIPPSERDLDQDHRLRSLAMEVGSLGQPESRESEETRILKQLIAKHGL